MKAFLICIITLVLFACNNNNEAPPEGKIELLDTVQVQVNFPKQSNTDVIPEKVIQQVEPNRVTDIFSYSVSLGRVDLKPNDTKGIPISFSNTGQYTILTAAIGSLSGDGSAEIMHSLAPIVDGNSILYLHNPHNYIRGCKTLVTFTLFYQKRY